MKVLRYWDVKSEILHVHQFVPSTGRSRGRSAMVTQLQAANCLSEPQKEKKKKTMLNRQEKKGRNEQKAFLRYWLTSVRLRPPSQLDSSQAHWSRRLKHCAPIESLWVVGQLRLKGKTKKNKKQKLADSEPLTSRIFSTGHALISTVLTLLILCFPVLITAIFN